MSEVGIIGYGSSAYHRRPLYTEFGYLWEAASKALNSATVKHTELDGLAVSSSTLRGDNAVTASEHFGLKLNWASGSVSGGAGSLVTVMDAVEAVRRGKAKYILCLAGACQDKEFFRSRTAVLNQAVTNYLTPHGVAGVSGLFALIQRKHMEQFGTRREDLAQIAIGQRASAALTERALLKSEMTLADYINAPMVADPLGLLDCVMPCSGAEAVLVGPLDRVADGQGVRILSQAQRYNQPTDDPAPLSGGWEYFRDDFYNTAGLGPDECEFVQCYDDYPIMVAIQLEDLGFCKKGEIGSFLRRETVHWNGSFPVNTGGGQLSCGQCGGGGGMIGLVEAVEQLRHAAGPRQVPAARHGVVAGYGMVAYGHGLGATALFLERANA